MSDFDLNIQFRQMRKVHTSLDAIGFSTSEGRLKNSVVSGLHKQLREF